MISIKLLSKIGVDKPIAYSSGARIIQTIFGVASIFFIARYLSEEEQGFYFTFGSIMGIQVFLELGFTTVLTQFVAHESATLKWNENNELEGDERNKSRLSSLIHFTVRWYSWITMILILVLIVSGYLFFNTYNTHSNISWQMPWVLAAIAISTKFLITPFHSILMGFGRIEDITKMQFGQQLIIPIVTLSGLLFGCKLYVIGMGIFVSSLYCIWYMYSNKLLKLLYNIYRITVVERIDYMKEVFPFQWRISISWISGYFIHNLFNPVIFATAGPVAAGQMGLTMQCVGTIVSLSASWMNTKEPIFSKLIALKDYLNLDRLFSKTLKQMTFVTCCLYLLFLTFISIMNYTHFEINAVLIYNRFLPYILILLLIVSVLIQQVVGAWASYLRCHKKEPFLFYSVTLGLTFLILIPISGKLYGLYGVCLSYFITQITLPFWGYHIYKTKKQQWHKNEEQ
jgi:O-antigen/teichoic acid export membrane protein